MRRFRFRAQPLLEMAIRVVHRSTRDAVEAGIRVEEARKSFSSLEKVWKERLSVCHSSFARLWSIEAEAIRAGHDYGGLLRGHQLIAQRAAMALNTAANELAAARKSCASLQAASTAAVEARLAAVEEKKRIEQLRQRDYELFRRNNEREQTAELSEVGAVMQYLAKLEAEESGSRGAGELQ